MMHVGRYGLLCALALSVPPAWAETRAEDFDEAEAPLRLLVFVGEPVSIGKWKSIDCGPDCISLDVVWPASYRPLQWLEGGPEPGPIGFSIAGHTETPGMKHRTALLFVFDRPHRQLARYRILPVDPTVDGRWAQCGDRGYEQHAALLRPIAFRDDVVIENVGRWPAQRIAKEFPAPTYELRGDEVHCTRGIYAEDLARVVVAEILEDLAD